MVPPVRSLGAFALVSLLIASCAPTSARSVDAPAVSNDGLAIVPLTVRTAKGTIHYRVEVAATAQQQSRGLMYRTSLSEHGGMIFPMVPPRFASFWMKNTYIPLDIIFIRADGTIERVAANAVPEDLSPVESGEPVAAVLEIKGGTAAAKGIVAGDRVEWGK